jgi:integrase
MFKDQLVGYKVIYDRKKQANKKGKAVVQIEAYQNGNRKYFSTGVYLAPDQWNVKKNEPKDPYHASQIRKVIAYYENFERETRHSQQDGKFSLIDFDKLKIRKVELAPPLAKQTFNQFFATQIKARDKELKWNTYRQQMACLNLVNEFNPKITFEDLKYKVLDDLHQFMVNKGHCNSTSNKRHKILRAYMSKAIKLEMLSKNPYDNFKIPTPVVNKTALIGSELKALEGIKFLSPNGRPERVRDMFLFATYTGLRWGDVSAVTRQNLIKTDDGIVLNIKAAKTEKVFQLPLWIMFEGKAQDLALKYWPITESAKLFPNMNNAYANRALKKLATSANIKKHLHFHVSRHTTGTILAQTAGVLTAKDVLQHSKLDTTMGYLHLSNAERNKSLKDVENWY